MEGHQHIALNGFMGVGKTSIGKQLALQMHRPFIDTDEEISSQMIMPITDIFSIHGESFFRELEEKTVITACNQQQRAILSLGGGAFLSEKARAHCFAHTFVVSLHMSFEKWYARMTPFMDSRPLLQQKTLFELRNLYEERQLIYRDCHFQLCVDELTINEAVMEIGRAYEGRGKI
ncbi:shikimate kinase [Shouchella lonarensis]|uniref:Shikimate kinase n=1 Tax=Shouchella lonarensis TaxID=1464122 RepID=A0A1G6ICY9_9BACI|nr:shikimate kinase [Shouchella lonarensis]SDC04270.1 shikimate kinase [Shouchella lonarensis]